MTIAYVLGQNPFWNPNDLLAEPFIDGTMASFRDVARSQKKAIYQDPGGMVEYEDPITFDGSGTAGPFYFANDEAYYLEFYDRLGNLVRTMEHYTPGSGGSAPVNNYIDFDNKLINGQFRFFDTSSFGLQSTTFTPLGPYWYFWKDIPGAADAIQFNRFPLGQTDVEANPVYYLSYVCNNVQLGETFKYIYNQVNDVNAFENRQITIQFQLKSSLSNTAELYFIQYFGTGGAPSTTVITPVQAFNLVPTWDKYSATFTVPTTGGKTIGSNGDDAVYIALGLPLSTIASIQMTNVQLNIGNIVLPYYFRTEEMEAPLVQPTDNAVPIGTIIDSYSNSTPAGYIPCDFSEYETIDNGRLYFPLAAVLNGQTGFGYDGFYSPYWAITSNRIYVQNTNNSSGSIPATTDVNTGFTFTSLNTFSFENDYTIRSFYLNEGVLAFENSVVSNSALLTGGNIGFAVQFFENTVFFNSQAVIRTKFEVVISKAASFISPGQYFTIPDNGDGNHYRTVWYNVNGSGTQPSVPGTAVYIQVNIVSGETIAEVAMKTAAAIEGYQLFSIVVPSIPPAGSYFLTYTLNNQYYVWFTVNGVGSDPIISGKKGVRIDLTTSMTTTAIAQLISYNMALIKFNAPGLLDVFIRGAGSNFYAGGGVRLGGSGIGLLQIDDFESHSHNYSLTGVATPVGRSGTDSLCVGSLSQTTTPTSLTGNIETRPRNINLNRYIKY